MSDSFDPTRIFFPVARPRPAARPPLDAPTLAEIVAGVVFGERKKAA